MRAGGVGVAPEPLQRMVEKKALAAGGEEQRIDRLDRQPHAERLIAAVAQPHVDADGFAARRRVVGFRQIAKHHQPRGVDTGRRLGGAQLHRRQFGHPAIAAVTAPRVVRTFTMSRNTASAPSAMPSTGATMVIGSTARNDCL